MAAHSAMRARDILDELAATEPVAPADPHEFRLVAEVDGLCRPCGETTFRSFSAAQSAVRSAVEGLAEAGGLRRVELQSTRAGIDAWRPLKQWGADSIARIIWQKEVTRALARLLAVRPDTGDEAAAPPDESRVARAAKLPTDETTILAAAKMAVVGLPIDEGGPVGEASPDERSIADEPDQSSASPAARQVPVMPALDADEIGLATELARPGLVPLVSEISFGDSRLDSASGESGEVAAEWDAVARGLVSPPPLPREELATDASVESDLGESAASSAPGTLSAVVPMPEAARPISTADAFEHWSRYEQASRREVAMEPLFAEPAASNATAADDAQAPENADDWSFPLSDNQAVPPEAPLWPQAGRDDAGEPEMTPDRPERARAVAASATAAIGVARQAAAHDSYAALRVDLSDDSVAGLVVQGVDPAGRPTRVISRAAQEAIRHPGSASWILPFTIGFAAVSLIVFVLALADGQGWRMGESPPPAGAEEVRKTLPWDAATFPGEVDPRKDSSRPTSRPSRMIQSQ